MAPIPTTQISCRAYPLVRSAADTRVFGHPQIVEDQGHVAQEFAHFLGDVAHSSGFDHAEGRAAKPRDVLQAVARTDATAVLIEVPVENIVATVLDGPLTAADLEKASGRDVGGRAW